MSLREWRQRYAGPVYASMTFAERGLFLGAQTCLAKFESGRSSALGIQGPDERTLALLSVAYGYAVSASILGFIQRAARAYVRGETALADIHLAHGGLPEIKDLDRAAYRLFLADRLLAEGMDPGNLLDALEMDSTALRLLKASSDDPNHPGWPAGTSGGRGGKFRPKDQSAAFSNLPVPIPVADFSGGFHDVVVKAWIEHFRKNGIAAVESPALRFIGPNDAVIGYPDMIVRLPGIGLAVIEVKTGNDPPLTPQQAGYIPMLQIGGHIYSRDARVTDLGLAPGVPLPPLPVFILRAPGPGLPYSAHELPPPGFEP